MKPLRAGFAFLYDFLVGDDLLLFLVAAAAIGATAAVVAAGVNAWWLLPLAVGLGLAGSVVRAARPRSTGS